MHISLSLSLSLLYIVWYLLGCPMPGSSHHQDYYIFRLGDPSWLKDPLPSNSAGDLVGMVSENVTRNQRWL